MPKHRHQNKVPRNNRVDTSVSIDPEAPSQFQQPMETGLSPNRFTPSYEDIQKRAYQIHEEKGGSELENWFEAEQALKQALAAPHS